jgi:hypothetical protein
MVGGIAGLRVVGVGGKGQSNAGLNSRFSKLQKLYIESSIKVLNLIYLREVHKYGDRAPPFVRR